MRMEKAVKTVIASQRLSANPSQKRALSEINALRDGIKNRRWHSEKLERNIHRADVSLNT